MTADSKRIAIFTICSNNYMAFAKTLLASAAAFHPQADLFLCLADEPIDLESLYPRHCTVVPARDLAIPDFPAFAFRYDVMEFNTAVKPYMFLHLFEALGYDAALYFDPDIEVFARLDAILEPLALGAPFVLTPHLLSFAEAPDEPNDFTIMRAGCYNLGFMAAARGDASDCVLRWWARRLRFECINAQDQGIFVDQKFVDLVPGFADGVAICRDPALNVAYWNLDQRRLEGDGDAWTVNDCPLGFFHFSGFDPNDLGRLSRHTERFCGTQPAPRRALMEHYAQRLRANGYGELPSGSYAYGRFTSGTPIPPFVRRMFRDWHAVWPGDPFASFETYLQAPWPGAARDSSSYVLTNLMKYMFDSLPELNARRNLRDPAHVREMVRWFVLLAEREQHLDPRLVEPAAERLGHRRFVDTSRMGPPELGRPDVSVVGYLSAASGVGEGGRCTLRTLAHVVPRVEGYDIDLNVLSDRDDSSSERWLAESVAGRVQVFNVNADQLALVMGHLRPRIRQDSYRIAVPFWELSTLPEASAPAFDLVDEVWAPSHFVQSTLVRRLSKPVLHMPLGLTFETPAAAPRAAFGLPQDRFLFFFAFDLLSYIERKNPRALVAAFRAAFPRRGHACLVLKALNGGRASKQLDPFAAEIADDPDIILLDRSLSRDDTLRLIGCCDAVVSLHRSEGLGLLVAEAMVLGKPVVATDYSGTTEFVSPRTGYPVDFRLIAVNDGEYPFAAGQVWADPDVRHAAWLMSRVVDHPQEARERAEQAKSHMHRRFGAAHVAGLQRQRLRELGVT